MYAWMLEATSIPAFGKLSFGRVGGSETLGGKGGFKGRKSGLWSVVALASS